LAGSHPAPEPPPEPPRNHPGTTPESPRTSAFPFGIKATEAVAGNRFNIAVTGDTVIYERNDQVLHTSTKKPTFPLVVDTSFIEVGTKATNVKLLTI
jgi:hypothetical protein